MISRKRLVFVLSSLMAAATLAIATAPAQAQTPGQERREQRGDAREIKQEGRGEAREAKKECRKGDEKSRPECRQDKREAKQDAREAARDARKGQ